VLVRDPSLSTGSSALAPVSRTLLDVFNATVANHPDRLALDVAGGALTYAELQQRAGELASDLRSLGIGPGDRVGVLIPSGTCDLYLAILAVLYAGAAYVPVDDDDPEARSEWIFAASDVAAVIGPGLAISARRKGIGEPRAWALPTTPG
jgi:non-ribosomal peptide synthetase component F